MAEGAGRPRERRTTARPWLFFALGAVIVATGFAVQLRCPERRIAGVQQAAIGLLALGIAGLIGGRVEPLTGSLVSLVATAILVALYPARRRWRRGCRCLWWTALSGVSA